MAEPVYAALDLETTGLDLEEDRITEVGIVRFQGDVVLDRYSTFVNPGRPIPFRIVRLTGIHDADVAAAPPIEQLHDALLSRLAGATVVGHNIRFDLDFLAAQGLDPPAGAIDTMELALLLDPAAPRRGLADLAQRFGFPLDGAHRALADADAVRELFCALAERARQLPPDLLLGVLQLARIGDARGWSALPLLERIAAERGLRAAEIDPLAQSPALALRQRRPALPLPRGRAAPATAAAQPVAEPLAPPPPPPLSGPPEPIAHPLLQGALDELALSVLEAGRRLPDLFDRFEERAEQRGMTRAVARVLEDGGHLLVEAGTGTGKSIAYLIPAAIRALREGRRVVVSTNTINLQQQLEEKDVPALRALLADALGADVAAELRVATLKGRANYLCLRRLAQERPRASSLSDVRLLGRLLVWLRETATGDRAELRLSSAEARVWSRLSAEGQRCLTDGCPYVRDGFCFLLRARRRAEAAHIVIVNHALLLSDLAAGGGAVPAADTVLIDEAHHLEDVATEQFGARLDEGALRGPLEQVYSEGAGGSAGLAAEARRFAAAEPEPLPALVEQGTAALAALFDRLAAFVLEHADDQFAGTQRLRLTRGARAQPAWAEIEIAWEQVFQALRDVHDALHTLGEALLPLAIEADEDGREAIQALATEAEALAEQLQERAQLAGELLAHYDQSRVVWLSINTRGSGGGEARLSAAPLQVDGILAGSLFEKRRSVVLTGATLCADGDFAYLRERLGLADGTEERFGSPFDYRRAVRLLLPGDMPEPNDARYPEALARAVVALTLGSGGRALALFTSHGALRAAAAAVREPLEAAGIAVLVQGPDGSAARVAAELRDNPATLVLGTSALWEGVDLAGEALSLLIVARLPFPVPSDPVFAARAELYDDSFGRYTLPQALLRFRQGFGRLIRRRSDSGVVAVLDGRIRERRYGAAFVRSLPPVQVEELPVAALGRAAAEWLAR